MQAQHRNAFITRQRLLHFIKPSARAGAKQASLNQSDIVPKTDTEQAGNQNSEMSVAPTSANETLQNEHGTQQPAQSHADTRNTANDAPEPFDEETVLPLFRTDVAVIGDAGRELETKETAYSNKTQGLAIKALAKILGLRHKYFNPVADDTVAIDTLKDELYKLCERKRQSKATSEYHLFSTILRKNDRKQASADAKVLKRAHAEGQTEESFADWVKTNGNLSDIVKKVNKDERDAKDAKEQQQRAKRAAKGKEKALFDAALEASWMHVGDYDRADLPESMIDLIPSAGAWRPIAIKYDGEKVIFYTLQKDSNYNELKGHKIEDIEPKSDVADNEVAGENSSAEAGESITS
ncbi:hypothetical protein [Paraburkholderia domus]|uniref:hypothetical protein n=1 Tax=Paraburkholderia domus TaxID=2793075 RepID=UPI001B10F55E|nr:hypothetical protein [Paraburkholderia domus]CAE6768429.1 hypothetical protein R75483_03895 [Paraburkholderia domus]